MEIKILVENEKPDLHCGAGACEKSDIWELAELSEDRTHHGSRTETALPFQKEASKK